MSFTDLKREMEHLTPEQRHEVAVLLSRLMDSDEKEQLTADLARRHAAMDAGQKTTLEDLKRAHEQLISDNR
jgi:hypothetical protein